MSGNCEHSGNNWHFNKLPRLWSRWCGVILRKQVTYTKPVNPKTTLCSFIYVYFSPEALMEKYFLYIFRETSLNLNHNINDNAFNSSRYPQKHLLHLLKISLESKENVKWFVVLLPLLIDKTLTWGLFSIYRLQKEQESTSQHGHSLCNTWNLFQASSWNF